MLYNPDQEDEEKQKTAAAGGVAFAIAVVTLPIVVCALTVVGCVGWLLTGIK